MYEIIIASDDVHEKVYAEIYFQGKYVALLNQEQGLDNLEIEFPDCNIMDQQMVTRAIPLKKLIYLIDNAKFKLMGQ
jgi:hypothetical protein